jgi:hypothetical protein
VCHTNNNDLKIDTLVLTRWTAVTCSLSDSFCIADSNERQTDSCDSWSDFQETKRDSTPLDRGSDVSLVIAHIYLKYSVSVRHCTVCSVFT